jgi:hypothetical protein
MKKNIDIEKLVRWALRDELPKGRPVSDDLGRVIAKRFDRRPLSIATGARPDIDSLGYVPGAPHEDAERVADAVACIRTEARFSLSEAMADARKLMRDLLPVTHVATLREIAGVVVNPQALVVSCGIGNRRPGWDFAPRCSQGMVPYRNGRGALRQRPIVEGFDDAGALVELKPNRGKAAMKRGAYDAHREPRSPLNWHAASLLSIGVARAEYFAWQNAIAGLAHALRGALVEFEPVAPAAVPFPWIDGQPTSRVLSDGFPAGLLTVPLALGPTREATPRPYETALEVEARRGAANYQKARIAKTAAVRAQLAKA